MTTVTGTADAIASKHVVYIVRADLDGRPDMIWYVGACPLASFALLPDLKRNSEYQRVPSDTVLTVAIWGVHDNAEDATTAQAAIVAMMKPDPWFNIGGRTVEPTRGRSRGKLRCSNGQIYDTAKAAADALGVTAQMISAHLNNKPGATTVRGLRFERIDE